MPADPATPPAPSEEQQRETLALAYRQTRWNMVLAGILLAALIGFAVAIYLFAGQILEAKGKELLDDTKKEFNAHADRLTKEASRLVTDTFPPVSEAFIGQMKKEVPVYVKTFTRQGKRLATDLEARLKDKITRRYRGYLARFRNILKEEFPELQDPRELDRVMASFDQALHQLAEHYYVDDFRKEMDQIARTWNSIPPLRPRDSSPGALEKTLAKDLGDWLWLKAVENSSLARTTRAAGDMFDYFKELFPSRKEK